MALGVFEGSVGAALFVLEDDAEFVAAFDDEPEGAEPAEGVTDGVIFQVKGWMELCLRAVGAGEISAFVEEFDGGALNVPHGLVMMIGGPII
jgi:hypothetical protein